MSLVFFLFQIADLRGAVGLDAALYINTETALALQLGHFALQLFNLSKVNNQQQQIFLSAKQTCRYCVSPSIHRIVE